MTKKILLKNYSGKKFIEQGVNDESKNNKVDSEASIDEKMYSQTLCPISLFEKYLSKLSPCDQS